MPVRRVSADASGRPGYRWGRSGKVYRYTSGDAEDRARAYALAARQGRAIEASRSDAPRSTAPRYPSDRKLRALYRQWVRDALRPATRRILAAIEQIRREQAERERLRSARSDEDGDSIDEESASLLMSVIFGIALGAASNAPPPPTEKIRERGEEARRVAAQSARRGLNQSGMSRASIAARLEMPIDGILGIDVAPTAADQAVLEAWARDNVNLITSQPEEWLRGRVGPDGRVSRVGLEQIVSERVREGMRWDTLAKEIERRLGVAESHAELIARDQIGKLNSQITESTQRQAGIDSYRWRTADDERVRGRPGGLYPDSPQRHWQMEGKVVRWDSPPRGTGPYGEAAHAGMSIQCRCYAEAIIPDLDEDQIERDERRMGESVTESQDETGRAIDSAIRLPPRVQRRR